MPEHHSVHQSFVLLTNSCATFLLGAVQLASVELLSYVMNRVVSSVIYPWNIFSMQVPSWLNQTRIIHLGFDSFVHTEYLLLRT